MSQFHLHHHHRQLNLHCHHPYIPGLCIPKSSRCPELRLNEVSLMVTMMKMMMMMILPSLVHQSYSHQVWCYDDEGWECVTVILDIENGWVWHGLWAVWIKICRIYIVDMQIAEVWIRYARRVASRIGPLHYMQDIWHLVLHLINVDSTIKSI